MQGIVAAILFMNLVIFFGLCGIDHTLTKIYKAMKKSEDER